MEQPFPTHKQVKKHWDAQDRSIFRKPYSRDKGNTIINTPSELREVLSMEMSGQPVDLYKTRSPATTYDDPVASVQYLIQAYHSKSFTKKEFAEQVKTPIEHQLYLILYGNMTDHQKATNIDKLIRQLFAEQKRIEELVHREKDIELKRQSNLMKGFKLQEEMKANEEKRRRVTEQLAKEKDEE